MPFVSAVFVVLLILLARRIKPIHWTDRKASNEQLFIVILVCVISYVSMVYNNIVLLKNSPIPQKAIIMILYGAILAYYIVLIMRKTIQLITLVINKTTAHGVLKIAIMLGSMLYFMIAIINYILIVLQPSQYIGLETLSQSEIAFENLYYTFGLMITYSGKTINANSCFTKGIEMIEILCFYVGIGIFITNTISKASEQSSLEEKSVKQTNPTPNNKQSVKNKGKKKKK